MRLVKQSHEILGTPKSLYEAWGFVAEAARNCYQSQKSKPDESEEQFCRRLLLKNQEVSKLPQEEKDKLHLSPLEFGIVYLTISLPVKSWRKGLVDKYIRNPHSRVTNTYDDLDYHYYITTNLRVIIENGWEDDLLLAGPPTGQHIKACCFKLITCLHVYKDLTRHRPLSYAIESTRYCNYIKEKFGVSVTFVEFPWVKPEEKQEVEQDLKTIEDIYFKWINRGWQAQQAAEFLPQAVKGTVMLCGYEDSLQHMFNLRAEECSGPVHPLVAEIMKPLYLDYRDWLYQSNQVFKDETYPIIFKDDKTSKQNLYV